MKVHAEIEYNRKEEDNTETSIHSDICPPGCSSDNLSDKEYRKIIHDCLDEWLDNSNGTGIFYIGNLNKKIKEHLDGA